MCADPRAHPAEASVPGSYQISAWWTRAWENKSVFVVNRIITNTAIGRDVREALAAYPVHVLRSTVTQRVVFAEAAAQGQAVFETDANGPAAAEIEAVAAELMEYAK